ncbi:hypothetical protein IFM89_036226, partial [Coptis chinensis]
QLLILQSKIDFQHSPSACDLGAGLVPIRHKFGGFVKPASSKGLSIGDIYLSRDDLDMYIDLAPFLNPSPYIVPEDVFDKGICMHVDAHENVIKARVL